MRPSTTHQTTTKSQGTEMSKRILLAVAVAAMFAAVPAAHAGTATGNFNVTVNLTSKCEITAGPADVAFTYTSFQTTAATGTGGAYSVRCTNTLHHTSTLLTSSHPIISLTYSFFLTETAATCNVAAH